MIRPAAGLRVFLRPAAGLRAHGGASRCFLRPAAGLRAHGGASRAKLFRSGPWGENSWSLARERALTAARIARKYVGRSSERAENGSGVGIAATARMRTRTPLFFALALAGCYVQGQTQVGGWEPTPVAAPVAEVDVDADDTDPTALATFRPALDPYGVWVEDATFGVVWVPATTVVGVGFSPYVTHGHWAYTSEGYYWVSDFAWGWGPFHYGRWVWSDGYGWVWIPGARYSPAWVEWRSGNGYMGWGPAYPHYGWRGGAAVTITLGVTPFVFVHSHHFFHPQGPSHHLLGHEHHGAILGATTPYTPPPRPLHGARPFLGPPPVGAGLPPDHVKGSTIAPPLHAKPGAVAWTPAPSSKLAPRASRTRHRSPASPVRNRRRPRRHPAPSGRRRHRPDLRRPRRPGPRSHPPLSRRRRCPARPTSPCRPPSPRRRRRTCRRPHLDQHPRTRRSPGPRTRPCRSPHRHRRSRRRLRRTLGHRPRTRRRTRRRSPPSCPPRGRRRP